MLRNVVVGAIFSVGILAAIAVGQPRPSGPIDLTRVLSPTIPVFPGGAPPQIARLAGYDQGYLANLLVLGEHTGTHVDAPAHFAQGQPTADAIPPEALWVRAVVVDLRRAVEHDPDAVLSLEHLSIWEREHHRPIPSGSLVLVRTGWGARWPDATRYLNRDAQGVMHFPGISREAADYLVRERHVVGVGIDTLSIDPGPSRDFAAHHAVNGAGRYAVENLDLERLDAAATYRVVVGLLPVFGGSGGPARVLAVRE